MKRFICRLVSIVMVIVSTTTTSAAPRSAEEKRADQIAERAKADPAIFKEMLSIEPEAATMRLMEIAQRHTPRGRAAAEVLRRVPGNEMYIYRTIAAKAPLASGPRPPRKSGAKYTPESLPEHKMPFACGESRDAIMRIFSRLQTIPEARLVAVIAPFLYEDGYEYDGGDYGSVPVCAMAANTLGLFRLFFDNGLVADPLLGTIPLSSDVNVLRAWWENNNWRYPPLPALPILGPPMPTAPPPPPTAAVAAPPPAPVAVSPKPTPFPAPAAPSTPTTPPPRWPWLAAAAALLALGLGLWARRRTKRNGE